MLGYLFIAEDTSKMLRSQNHNSYMEDSGSATINNTAVDRFF